MPLTCCFSLFVLQSNQLQATKQHSHAENPPGRALVGHGRVVALRFEAHVSSLVTRQKWGVTKPAGGRTTWTGNRARASRAQRGWFPIRTFCTILLFCWKWLIFAFWYDILKALETWNTIFPSKMTWFPSQTHHTFWFAPYSLHSLQALVNKWPCKV